MPKLDIADIFQPTILLTLALMTIIVMMILPMPAIVLDIGLAGSFALAILIFTVTLFIERPLDFSSFPTVLLASLVLRLSLNVSSTKLIIGQGHTGTGAICPLSPPPHSVVNECCMREERVALSDRSQHSNIQMGHG